MRHREIIIVRKAWKIKVHPWSAIYHDDVLANGGAGWKSPQSHSSSFSQNFNAYCVKFYVPPFCVARPLCSSIYLQRSNDDVTPTTWLWLTAQGSYCPRIWPRTVFTPINYFHPKDLNITLPAIFPTIKSPTLPADFTYLGSPVSRHQIFLNFNYFAAKAKIRAQLCEHLLFLENWLRIRCVEISVYLVAIILVA